jgi:hypothetical protein
MVLLFSFFVVSLLIALMIRTFSNDVKSVPERSQDEADFIEKMKQRAATHGNNEWYEKELEKQKAIKAFEQAKAVSAGSDYDVDKDVVQQ